MKARAECIQEASEWLLRLEDPQRMETDFDDWLSWCDEDPGHYRAFETVQQRWRDLDSLKPLLARMASADAPPARWLSRPYVTGLAATVLLMMGAALLHFRTMPAASSQLVAAELVNRSATLPDGSRMILGAQSAVNMDFSDAARQLELSAGKAYFEVTKDPQRPFVVQVAEVRVTAIGTAFEVRREAGRITVTVEEGAVEVASLAPGDLPERWRAQAGYQLTYSTQGRTAYIASVDPSIALAWRRGELAYLHETLGAVVEDLNRYSTRRIVIEDPALAQLTFTGTVFAAQLDGWIRGIEQAYPIVVGESDAGDITFSARR